MKNCKTFYETQIASHLQEIIQPSPKLRPSDKIYITRAYYFQSQVN